MYSLYSKLPAWATADSEDGGNQHSSMETVRLTHLKQRRVWGWTWNVMALLSVILNVLFISMMTGLVPRPAARPIFNASSGRLYSPAQHVLRRVDRVFASSFGGGRTPFQGAPNETNNQLWKDLYNWVGISRLSTDEARPMVNHTLPIPGDPGHYITSLSVFHQLHCLNLVRLGLYGQVDWTNQDEYFAIEHLDHCIDMLRQNLQCNSDITPITWVWSRQRNRALEEARVIHTCTDFDAIHQWGAEHRLKFEFDAFAKVPDDPLGWGVGTEV